MNPLTLHPIGIIHSPHSVADKTPIQPAFATGIQGTAQIEPAYEPGLADIDGFSHLYLLYHLHHTSTVRLQVQPFLEDMARGVFATRAPCRPNPIGLSVVRLVGREGCTLHLEDLDILDNTPLLDIKPYVARFDHRADARFGWLEQIDDSTARQRGRRGFTP